MRVEIDQRNRELNSFDEIVEKTVDAKVKATLRPRSYTCKTDQYCARNSYHAAIKFYIQASLMKDLRVKESKARTQEAWPQKLHASQN